MEKNERNYFQALYDVAKVINASLDMTTVLEKIVESVVETMDVKASSIRLLDTRKKKLIMSAAHGLSKGYIHKGPVLVNESGVDRRALMGELVTISDAQTDPDFQYGAVAKDEGIKTVLVVPLKAGEKSIGVLRVYASEIREFNEEETLFIEAVTNLSAIALDNARLHQALKTNYDLLVAHKYRLDDN